ncbi:MAG: SprB repeat-containing protein, partial [Bacteroidota bacterium]
LLETSFLLEDPQPFDVGVDIQEISCFGETDGSIELIISGGTPDYDVDWTGPGGFVATGSLIEDLGSGSYTATISDQSGCQTTMEVELNEPEEIVLDTSSENTTCNEANGSVSVIISGGQNPYDITWLDSDNNSIGTDADVFNLPAGTYTVQIMDNNGCISESGAVVSDSDVMTITGSTTDPLCADDLNGAISIEIMGGNGNLTFEWTGPAGYTNDTQNISDLASGTYVVEVTDEDGCVSAEQFEINAPDPITISDTVSNVTCFGQDNGSIEITVEGGSPDYTISWSGPNGFNSMDLIITDLIPGTYSVTVQDINGCEANAEYEITEDSELVLNASTTPLLCFGETTGSIDLEITGGTAPYDISWSDSNGIISNNEDLNNLGPDTYTVLVIDDFGCDAQMEVIMEENPELTVSIDAIQPACLSSDGSLEATVSGGAEPYQYFWYDLDNGNALLGNDPLLTGLNSGNYLFEVIDANLCVIQSETLLTDASGGVVLDVTSPLCFGDSNGAISSTVDGAQDPYTVEWNGPNGFTSDQENISDLFAGDYTIQITDALGCLFGEAITLEEPELLEATPTPGNPLCFGDSNGTILLDITGGTEPYIITWTGDNGLNSSDQNVSDLAEGCYDYSVVDDNGCQTSGQVCLIAPTEIEIITDTVDILCHSDSTGQILTLTQGGSGGYTFDWTGPNGYNSVQETITDLFAGDYELTVTDINGCQAQTLATIN